MPKQSRRPRGMACVRTIKTTFRTRVMPFAWTSCSTISPAVRSAVSPIVPVAQKVLQDGEHRQGEAAENKVWEGEAHSVGSTPGRAVRALFSGQEGGGRGGGAPWRHAPPLMLLL